MQFFLTISLLSFLSFSLYAKNDLAKETSPYLLQHANNPVDWMPWGDAALTKAKKEDKRIFLSIGYSTCHWCHMMEKESFKNKKIAKLLNKYFICIKVDKEEMPHLDNHFQALYKKFKGKAGGWPLNIFMDVNQNIYYISTYIPPVCESYLEGFNTLIKKIANLKKPLTVVKIKQKKVSDLSIESLKINLLAEYDKVNGGFGKGKKFPEVSKLSLMFDIAQIQEDKKLYKYTYKMLNRMALRGLYDQVEGGFFRYCVDSSWEIPHFEKMLYTQASLVSIYTQAYILDKKILYKNIVTETIAMLEKRFTENNLYFSASDADSDGKEGYYFTYTLLEMKHALEKNLYKSEIENETEFVLEGNFNDRVHLNFYKDVRPKGFNLLRKKLLHLRERKIFPFRDKKINTAWNSLMIESLYKASYIGKIYATMAEKHLQALKIMMFNKGELYHQGIIGVKPKQKGLLEDYSFLIGALIAGYEYDYDIEKLHFAEYLLSQSLYKFYKNGVWYASDDDLHFTAKTNDKYYVSAVSKMIQNIFKIASLQSSFKYEKIAVASLKKYMNSLKQRQADTPALAQAFLMNEYGFITIKSSKQNLKDTNKIIKSISYPYIVNKVVSSNDFLICTMRRCFYKANNLNNIDETIKLNIRK